MKFNITILLLTLLFSCSFATLFAQKNKNVETDSLSPFSRLIGGEWQLEGSYQVFEWGVGKMSVKSRSYFMID